MFTRKDPEWNDVRLCFNVGETDRYLVDVVPMLYNHRVVLTPKDSLSTYDVGWCYPSLLHAQVALALCDDPETEEPTGAIKRVGTWPL